MAVGLHAQASKAPKKSSTDAGNRLIAAGNHCQLQVG